MRELILSQIQESINDGDDELVDMYGSYEEIAAWSDEKVLEVYGFMVGFRG